MQLTRIDAIETQRYWVCEVRISSSACAVVCFRFQCARRIFFSYFLICTCGENSSWVCTQTGCEQRRRHTRRSRKWTDILLRVSFATKEFVSVRRNNLKRKIKCANLYFTFFFIFSYIKFLTLYTDRKNRWWWRERVKEKCRKEGVEKKGEKRKEKNTPKGYNTGRVICSRSRGLFRIKYIRMVHGGSVSGGCCYIAAAVLFAGAGPNVV